MTSPVEQCKTRSVTIREFLSIAERAPTLSVYLHTPGKRGAVPTWRRELEEAVRAVRARCENDAARAFFASCVGQLERALPTDPATMPLPGWFGAFTPSGVTVCAGLPRPVPTRVDWGQGPVLLPLATAQIVPPVWILLVGEQIVRCLRLSDAGLRDVESFQLEQPAREGAHEPGVATLGEPVQQGVEQGVAAEWTDAPDDERDYGQRAEWQVLVANATRRLIGLMNRRGLAVIGGADLLTHPIKAQLPTSKAERALCSVALSPDASAETLLPRVLALVTPLLAERQTQWFDQLIASIHTGHHAVFQRSAVEAALAHGSVEHVAFTPAFARAWPDAAESACRQILRAGGTVEVVEPTAAPRLDALAGGIAARLRVMRLAPPSGTWAARRRPLP